MVEPEEQQFEILQFAGDQYRPWPQSLARLP